MARISLYIVLAVFAAVWSPLKACAGEPLSEIREISFRIGGGMSPYDQAYVNLLREKDSTLTLTLLGDCPNEKITFQVADSVMERCKELIREHKLWKSQGFYKPEYRILDAPSTSFSVRYEKYSDSFDASGDIPRDIMKGISAITQYLNSLRGDRQAVGHFKRTWNDKEILKDKTTWSNGEISFTPEEEGIAELLRYLSEQMGTEYKDYNWRYSSAVGTGIRALLVSNELLSYCDAFIDIKSANRTSTGGTVPPGKWPKGSRSLLTRSELSKMSEEDILMMEHEILARNGGTFRDKELQAYFDAQPWYKPNDYFRDWELSDIEQYNMRAISEYITQYRKNKNK